MTVSAQGVAREGVIDLSGGAGPLVSQRWLTERLRDPSVRLVEVDVDPKQYAAGHIPGAIGLDWAKDLQHPTRRDVPEPGVLAKLLGERGINERHTVVLYGDSANWFAAYAFWLLKLYRHADVRLLDGGRSQWLADDKLPFTTELPSFAPETYRIGAIDLSLRATVAEVLPLAVAASARAGARTHAGADAGAHAGAGATSLVDVRSPDEFSGKIIAPPGLNETAQRAGHIPGAISIPWGSAVNPDGTFKTEAELRKLYIEDKGVRADAPAIAYCRIGERSSHTWFVLRYLLGLRDVKNYDGSWTEYGNLIGAPIDKA